MWSSGSKTNPKSEFNKSFLKAAVEDKLPCFSRIICVSRAECLRRKRAFFLARAACVYWLRARRPSFQSPSIIGPSVTVDVPPYCGLHAADFNSALSESSGSAAFALAPHVLSESGRPVMHHRPISLREADGGG